MRLFPKNMDGILLLRRKSCTRNIKFSKSTPDAKPQNFVDISGAQKPTWAKFWEFEFFHLKRRIIQVRRLYRY